MKAKSDIVPSEPNSVKPDSIEGLFSLMKIVSNNDVVEKFESDFNNCNIRYGDMKKQLAEDMINFISPIRKRTEDIRKNENYMKRVMKHGAEKARANADVTLQMVRNAIGLKYY